MTETRVARCARCGAATPGEAERCVRCGALLDTTLPAQPWLDLTAGVPAQRYTPSLAGPPVAPEPFVHPARLPALGASRQRIISYGVVRPLPRRRSRAGVMSLAVLALLVIVGLAVGVWAQGTGALARGPLSFAFGAAPTATPLPATATEAPVCALAAPDPAAAAALTAAQLTTGVRDAGQRDYRPIDSVSRFTSGQQAYLTFKIATTQAGVAAVAFCTSAGVTPGSLDVPAGSEARYAQFSTRVASQDIGAGIVTLSWNGAVAASLPFSVDPPATVPAP